MFIFNLDQHMKDPTHKKGDVLDLVMARTGEPWPRHV